MKTYHYIVKGRVQGVAFRYYAQKEAYKNQVKGTVKNLFNGDVEVYAQGPGEALTNFERFLYQGPPFARIDDVIKEELQLKDAFTDFDIVF